jgi:hypothetical protein
MTTFFDRRPLGNATSWSLFVKSARLRERSASGATVRAAQADHGVAGERSSTPWSLFVKSERGRERSASGATVRAACVAGER